MPHEEPDNEEQIKPSVIAAGCILGACVWLIVAIIFWQWAVN